ncbi:MAG: HAD family hydrolase [Promethearchaeota archaeon]|jgi:epoxide hydrolase-like predicted phosphatase
MIEIKCIIFDLGGVIIDLDFSNFYNSIIAQSPLNKPQTPIMLEFFRQSDIYHQGLMSDKEFYQLACDVLQVCELDQESFFSAFNSIISGYNTKVVEIIKKIKEYRNLKLMCLSNVNSSHWEFLLKKKWDFFDYFDEFILSHEVHMTKPVEKIFQYAIQKAGCLPEEIAFIDDGLNNIHSAQKLGIIGIKFTNEENLIEDLINLQILKD